MVRLFLQRRSGIAILVCLAVGLIATASHATTLRVTFAGTVDTIEDPFGILTPSVVMGAPFSGEILIPLFPAIGPSDGQAQFDGETVGKFGEGFFVGFTGFNLGAGSAFANFGFDAFDTFRPSAVPSRAPSCTFVTSSATVLSPIGFVGDDVLGSFFCAQAHRVEPAGGDTEGGGPPSSFTFTSWSGAVTTLTVVPEPSLAVLLGCGVCAFRIRRAS